MCLFIQQASPGTYWTHFSGASSCLKRAIISCQPTMGWTAAWSSRAPTPVGTRLAASWPVPACVGRAYGVDRWNRSHTRTWVEASCRWSSTTGSRIGKTQGNVKSLIIIILNIKVYKMLSIYLFNIRQNSIIRFYLIDW